MSRFSEFIKQSEFSEMERVLLLTGAAIFCDDLADRFQREGADCESAANMASYSSDMDYYDGKTSAYYDCSHLAKIAGDAACALASVLLDMYLNDSDVADAFPFGGDPLEAL